MRLDEDTCRRLLTDTRHGYLATTGADAQPHVVPVTFALLHLPGHDEIVSAVDHKPKTTTALRRLHDIAENPRVAVLVDRYDDDWDRLWWVRAVGSATVDEPGPHDAGPHHAARVDALSALAAKYPQYVAEPPRGALVRLQVTRWVGWASGDVPQ